MVERAKKKSVVEEVVRARLRELKMSVTQLAEECDVTRPTIYYFFRGSFSPRLVRKISKCLDIPYSTLVNFSVVSEGNPDQDLLRRYHQASPEVKDAVKALLNSSPR